MALNIKPFFGPNDPFSHPPVTFPEKETPLRPFTSDGEVVEEHENLTEEAMREKVKKMFQQAKKIRLKRLDTL